MNKYFNEKIFEKFKIGKYNKDFDYLKNLTNIDIELLFLNLPVDQNLKGEKEPIYRPAVQEFKKNQEMIFSGCSQTHGDHICPPLVKSGSHEQIWGFLVAKKMNLDAINLGIGAEGIYRIIQRLISHFEAYGNPKTLLCLFPDPYRFTSPRDSDNLTANRPSGTYPFLQGTFHGSMDVKDLPLFSKKPYKKEEVIPKMIPLFFNMQSLNMIEQYCKSSGIKFLWGSWSDETNQLIKAIKAHHSTAFPSFVDLDKNIIDWKSIECHSDIYNKYPSLYSSGIDGWHMGMHRHAHIAESFIEVLSK